MNRRGFLHSALSVAAGSIVAPACLRAEVTNIGSAAHFERSLAREPWLVGWKTVGVETLGPTSAVIEGRLPAELRGALYRTGPAWFDRAGLRYSHWFDGDGMMQSWHIKDGGIRHQARMIATTKFLREQRAGRFLLPAAGTTVPDALPVRNNDDSNTGNTAVIRLGHRLFALWEGGSAIEIDPDTLTTHGPVTWRDDLAAAPFSAHPLIDSDGTLWNFGSMTFIGGSGLLLWRIGPDGKLVRVALLAADMQGYLHSFCMTRRYLVFMLMPFTQRDEGAAFFERLQFATGQPCRIAVVPKDALDEPRWFEAEFAAVYHFADAHEHGHELMMHAVRHADPEEARSPQAAAMRGERGGAGARTELVNLRLNLRNGRARWEHRGVHDLEFPVYDTRSIPTAPARLYAPVTVQPASAPCFNGVASIDAVRGRCDVHCYGADILAEEHQFVPKPQSRRAGAGWLIGTLLDPRRGRSGIAVLDAERITEGPLAIGWVPYTMPLGFHGWFDRTVQGT